MLTIQFKSADNQLPQIERIKLFQTLVKFIFCKSKNNAFLPF